MHWSRAIPLALLALVSYSHALHFYIDAEQKRCFVEELPTDTVVEGHYRALEWDDAASSYSINEELGIEVEVEEASTDHTVVKTLGPPEGKFTFTSHEPGDHIICLSSNYTTGWFSSRHIKLYLEIVVGAAKADPEHDRSHIGEVAGRIRDLNERLRGVRREQQYQREREAAYRDLSEATNSRALWYVIVQVAVLIGTCTWQLKHLRRFFEARKLR